MKDVRIIGFPISLGCNKIGTELAPNALRYAGLVGKLEKLGLAVEDQGNIPVENIRDTDSSSNAKNFERILKYDKILSEKVANSLSRKRFPLVLGGDHSMALGSIAGLSTYTRTACGVIFFDAHPDFNTPETTQTGNVHGMPLALASGLYSKGSDPLLGKKYADPKKIVVVGARSIDKSEEKMLDDAGVIVFTADEIDRRGMHDIVGKAIKIASKGNAPVHVSLDVDVVDPAFLSGTGTPVIGGLLTREVKLALCEIFKSGVMQSFELAELNPSLDKNNITVETALEFILVALGKKPYESLL